MGLPDNRHERTRAQLVVVRHGNCDGRSLCSLLHYQVTASTPHFRKAVMQKNGANGMPRGTRSLPNLNLEPGHKHLGVAPLPNLCRIRSFEE